MATIESIRSWLGNFDFQGYLASLPPAERQQVWQEHLDAERRDKELRERERAEKWGMPRDFDPTFYGFRTREEAECEFSYDITASEYVDIPVESVRSWLAYRRNIFLERQAFENEKRQQRHQREMFELQMRSQEMTKWQTEREEERGVRVKISKRKRLLRWLKGN